MSTPSLSLSISTTNRYLSVAAIVTGLATLVHAIGGEATTIANVTASDIPTALQVELRAMWHGGTVLLLVSSIILWRAAQRSEKSEAASCLAWVYGLWGIGWVGIALLMGAQNIVDAPQWVLLLGIAGLIFAGQRKFR